MFNITPGEFLMIAILGLIVLGPERLPDMARNLGKMVNKLRSLSSDLQETVNSISDDPAMKPIKDLGELATRPRQKLAQFAAEAEAAERADKIARERAEMDKQQERLIEGDGTLGVADSVDSSGESEPEPSTSADDPDSQHDSTSATESEFEPAEEPAESTSEPTPVDDMSEEP
ncbi:MAG: twin-arginine translocase TatA/TatE family subunit [Microthrixaceae bacterium]|nr:twin-arginine translocase TatA/TatE family subunit [Microthrixaceae bacterium]